MRRGKWLLAVVACFPLVLSGAARSAAQSSEDGEDGATTTTTTTTPTTTSTSTLALAEAEAEADPEVEAALDAQMAAVEKTEQLLVDKIAEREARVRARVRALYQMARPGQVGLWLDAGERRRRIAWEAAAHRVLGRDLAELAKFRDELTAARRAGAAIEAERQTVAARRRPPPRSLVRPVGGAAVQHFGTFTDGDTGTRLSRRGAELRSREGREVVAVADGVVAWTGPLRGLDRAVIVDHGGYTSVIARLGEIGVSAGQRVAAGQTVGTAAGRRVHLEIRLPAAAGGLPVDPEPLLRAP